MEDPISTIVIAVLFVLGIYVLIVRWIFRIDTQIKLLTGIQKELQMLNSAIQLRRNKGPIEKNDEKKIIPVTKKSITPIILIIILGSIVFVCGIVAAKLLLH